MISKFRSVSNLLSLLTNKKDRESLNSCRSASISSSHSYHSNTINESQISEQSDNEQINSDDNGNGLLSIGEFVALSPKSYNNFRCYTPGDSTPGTARTPKESNCSIYWWGLIPYLTNTQVKSPKQLKIPNVQMKSISARDMRCVILSQSGDVYVYDESQKIQTPNSTILLDRALLNDSIISVSTGLDHILALSSNGYVYSWGVGVFGELGFEEIKTVKEPSCIPHLKSIKSIGCGNRHSVAISNNGHIYYWGASTGMNYQVTKNITTPLRIGHVDQSSDYTISCGLDFSLILVMNQNRVYSFGRNIEGQCGHGDVSLVSPIRMIDLLFSNDQMNRIMQISAGQFHCLALSKSGRIYSWGDGELGQLGLGSCYNTTLSFPFKINYSKDFTQIACGNFHSLAQTSDGFLVCWGNNNHQLFVDCDNIIWEPIQYSEIKADYLTTGNNWVMYVLKAKSDISFDNNKRKRIKSNSTPRDIDSRSVIETWKNLEENFFTKKLFPETKKLIYSGIPKKLRPKFWAFLAGNRIHFTPVYYQKLKDMVDEQKLSDTSNNKVFEEIRLDVERTLPHLNLFSEDHPLNENIIEILEIFSHYRPDLRYVQSLSYIAGLISIYYQNDKYLACQVFLNMIVSGISIPLLRINKEETNYLWELFDRLLLDLNPSIYIHLHNIELDMCSFLLPWFMTLFVKYLPLDIVSFIIDLLLYDGPIILFKMAFIILDLLSVSIMENDYEFNMNLLNQKFSTIDIWQRDITLDAIKNRMKNLSIPNDINTQLTRYLNHIFIRRV